MRLEAQNASLPHLFEDVARQTFRYIIDPAEVGSALREKVAVEGESFEHLLREWIVTLTELVRTHHMVFSQFEVVHLKTPEKGPYVLLAEAVGELIDPQRHHLTPLAARLTCQEAYLRKDAQGYRAEALLQA